MESLRLNVASLLKEPTGSSRTRDVCVPPTVIGDRTLTSPLVGHLELFRIAPHRSQSGAVLALGKFGTTVASECSRCLESVTNPTAFSFEAAYYPQVDITTGRVVAPFQDDLGFDLAENHELDLTEAVRQHIELAMPMQPICSLDCSGLCPVCGGNRNHASCQHEMVEIDPRFAALQDLLSSGMVPETP